MIEVSGFWRQERPILRNPSYGPRFSNICESLKPAKYEPVEDLEFVRENELNEKLATLLNNFWTLQWKAISDKVGKTSRQCRYSIMTLENKHFLR